MTLWEIVGVGVGSSYFIALGVIVFFGLKEGFIRSKLDSIY